jgi:hypothetical protein
MPWNHERRVLAEGVMNLARDLGDCEFVPGRGGGGRLLLRPAAGELHERGVVAPDLARQGSKEIGELDTGVGRSRQADLAGHGQQ